MPRVICVESGKLWDVDEIPQDLRRLFEEVEVECGVPWEPWSETEEGEPAEDYTGEAQKDYEGAGAQDPSESKRRILAAMARKTVARGYRPACSCAVETVPGRVLDLFAGSGTVAQTARKLGRRSIGIELQPAYEAVIRQRLGLDGMFSEVEFEHMADR